MATFSIIWHSGEVLFIPEYLVVGVVLIPESTPYGITMSIWSMVVKTVHVELILWTH